MIFILTGSIYSGKTTFLKKVVNELKRQNLKIDGFLSDAVLKNQERIGYDLFDLSEERSIPFIRKKGEKGWEKIGSFFFIPQSLTHAKNIILRSNEADILVVDEVGPQELTGKGLWPALKQVIFLPQKVCLLVVRRNILKDFVEIVKEKEVKIFDVRKKGIFSQIIEEIKRNMKSFQKSSKVYENK